MSNPNAKDPATEAKQMTAAEAVKRAVTELVDGKDGAKVPRAKEGAVQGSEVLSLRDYGTHVVVVTKDGES